MTRCARRVQTERANELHSALADYCGCAGYDCQRRRGKREGGGGISPCWPCRRLRGEQTERLADCGSADCESERKTERRPSVRTLSAARTERARRVLEREAAGSAPQRAAWRAFDPFFRAAPRYVASNVQSDEVHGLQRKSSS